MRASDGAEWEALTGRLLHPTQVLIIEALIWIDHPLSAANLAKVFDDEELNLPSISYHVRRLVDLGVLKFVRKRPVRGALEKFYELALGQPRDTRRAD